MGVHAAGLVYLSDCTITSNLGADLARTAPGSINAFRNNRIAPNHPDGKPTRTLPQR